MVKIERFNALIMGNTRKPSALMDRQLMDRQSHALRLFYSYSHKDEGLRDELEVHLKLLQRSNLI